LFDKLYFALNLTRDVSLAVLNYQAGHKLFKCNSQSTQIIINVHGYFHASLCAPSNEIQEHIGITRGYNDIYITCM